ncbi:MAG: formylmethanofuran dehydrogenase subunit E family protein [Methanoregula sp.]|jgi:formylmethanofuran dehydrogenase subunit E
MKPGKHRFSPEDFNARMDACGLDLKMKDYLNRVVAFHTSPAPGVLIGVFMVDFALELLGAAPGEKLFGVCETPKCAPDALQVIANVTTGNNRLRVIPIGKFAITVNAATTKPIAEGVRVYIDLEKLKRYPVIDIWYANSPSFNKHTMEIQLQEEIFSAGRDILSFEHVRLRVTPKRKWKSVTCPCCGDTIPDYLFESDRCGGCGSMKYFEKILE